MKNKIKKLINFLLGLFGLTIISKNNSHFLNSDNLKNENLFNKYVEAMNFLRLDFFGGWEESDLDLLKKYLYSTNKEYKYGYIYDWLGVVTPIKFHGWIKNPSDHYIVKNHLPVPNDEIHADAIEYIALLKSFELTKNKKNYTAVELGSSYSPWASAAGVVAKRKKYKNINLVAVEASKKAIPKIEEQFKVNNLLECKNLKIFLHNSAVSEKNGYVYFPDVDTNSDNGAQISKSKKNTDYRGLNLNHVRVNSKSLSEITKNFSRVDFLHMDLQGAEEFLIENNNFINCINKKVKVLFFATQSRLIEGKAVKVLFNNNWTLYRERPTTYKQNKHAIDPNGWTLRDGAQIWINNEI